MINKKLIATVVSAVMISSSSLTAIAAMPEGNNSNTANEMHMERPRGGMEQMQQEQPPQEMSQQAPPQMDQPPQDMSQQTPPQDMNNGSEQMQQEQPPQEMPQQNPPQTEQPPQEMPQQDQGFFGRIGNTIKESFNSFKNWMKDLFGHGEDGYSENENTGTPIKPADETEGYMPRNIPGGIPIGSENENAPGYMPGASENANTSNNMPGGMDGGNAPETYEAAYTVTENIAGDGTASYSSDSSDENAILVDNSVVTISGISVTKTGDSNTESADFYGINAGVLANNGSDLTMSDVTVTTDGSHANGVFSYGEGTTVTISDSSITTSGNNSGGLMTTGGATLVADNVTISTTGNSSAAIRTDRGGGTVTATETTASTSGVGSPTIYSTADITVSDSTLSATNSEAVVIEGGNSVTITDSALTGNNATLNGQSTTATNVLIYQSMSGDAQEGSSEFNMTGGSLTALTGSMFHVTNVTTTINLNNVELIYSDDSNVLIDLSADSWGTEGKNGGNATVNLSNQSASGEIVVDDVSSLVFNLTNGSDYTGAIDSTNSSGTVSVSIEEGSTWTLTGDTYIDNFNGNLDSINFNGYKLYTNGLEYTQNL